jgi:uncharacterized membrane protein
MAPSMNDEGRVIVVVSWDGVSQRLAHFDQDDAAAFDIILFDYSGKHQAPDNRNQFRDIISVKTECKGQIYAEVARYLRAKAVHCSYIGLFDDDISVRVSDINLALRIAVEQSLDSFALTLTPDSVVNHKRFIQQPGPDVRPVAWVEVMMPFYRLALFDAGHDFYQGSVSSYGIDQFVMPLVQKVTGMGRVAVIDRIAASHLRPMTSDQRVFSNGLTAHQERGQLRRKCLDVIASKYPYLQGTAWYYRTFAPLNGPLAFLRLYLLFPFHLALRVFDNHLTR